MSDEQEKPAEVSTDTEAAKTEETAANVEAPADDAAADEVSEKVSEEPAASEDVTEAAEEQNQETESPALAENADIDKAEPALYYGGKRVVEQLEPQDGGTLCKMEDGTTTVVPAEYLK